MAYQPVRKGKLSLKQIRNLKAYTADCNVCIWIARHMGGDWKYNWYNLDFVLAYPDNFMSIGKTEKVEFEIFDLYDFN